MAPSKVMLIRHAEKPVGSIRGVAPDGSQDAEDLAVRGWQRAGALVRLFAPLGAEPRPPLARPQSLFAAGVGPGSASKRHIHTLAPLADLLGLPADSSFLKGETQALAQMALTRTGVLLICWEHKQIKELVSLLTEAEIEAPKWPSDRFDMIFVLDKIADGWSFIQQPQQLLAGDGEELFPLGEEN